MGEDAKTAQILDTPLVWSAVEDLALVALTTDVVVRLGLFEWLERHPLLDRSALG